MSLYSKLEENETRLLILHPGHFDDDIKTSLRTASLFTTNLEPYQALSYVWGDANITEVIFCNGKSINITVNLALALRYIRSETQPCTIWADAICINQTDVGERIRQVGLMQYIYSKADEVVIWVGEADESTEEVMNWFREFDHHWEDETHRAELVYISENNNFQSRLEKVRQFVARSWFHRAWTFQEACLSDSALVRCGSFTLPWLTICSTCIMVRDMAISELAFGNAHANLQSLAYCSVMARVGNTFRLNFLLCLTRTRQATDPRDKIYSLLGLVQNSMAIASYCITPEYCTSVEEIYTTAAKRIVATDRNLEILSASNGFVMDSNLPSWVPDWRTNLFVKPINNVNTEIGAESRFDCSCTRNESKSPIQQKGKLQELHLLGSRCAEVVSVWRLEELSRRLHACKTEHIEFFEEIRGFFGQIGMPSKYEPKDEASVIAFLRTLSADTLPISKRVSVASRKQNFPWHHDWLRQEVDIDLKIHRWQKIGKYFGIDSVVLRAKLYSKGLDMTNMICQIYGELFGENSRENLPARSKFLHKVSKLFGDTRPQPSYFSTDVIKSRIATELAEGVLPWLAGRSFVMLDNGLIGLAPATTTIGDLVYLLDGAKVPFALRSTSSKPTEFKLLGECYIHGIMYRNELPPKPRRGRRSVALVANLQLENITII